MQPVLKIAEIRELEAFAMERGESGAKLMERAGRRVLEAMTEWRPELDVGEHSACVLCGPGNNGGDGLVIARLLKEGGWHVEAYLAGDETKLTDDAAVNLRRFRWTRGEIKPLKRPVPDFTKFTVVVDALFGAGLTRPLNGAAALAAEALSEPGPRAYAVVAVDAPSGLCMDSGRVIGPVAVRADLTVSFQSPRAGLYLAEGPAHVGHVAISDIGLPMELWSRQREELPPALGLIDAPEPARLDKAAEGHKHAHGHAVVFAGPPGAGGAARLAARAALRVGAGLVTLACAPEALTENAARLDAVMLAALEGEEAVGQVIADERKTAFLIGPGHGVGPETVDRVEQLLAGLGADGRPAVLDADALTSFGEEPSRLFEWLTPSTVLTPHLGEFRQLFPDLAAELTVSPIVGPAQSRIDLVRKAAERAGAVVLLKGPDTVIAEPGGAALIHPAQGRRHAAWLATAGSGDVLGGLIAGLLARGHEPLAAAGLAAWLHVAAAAEAGPGLIAEDLPEAIPAVFRGLGL